MLEWMDHPAVLELTLDLYAKTFPPILIGITCEY